MCFLCLIEELCNEDGSSGRVSESVRGKARPNVRSVLHSGMAIAWLHGKCQLVYFLCMSNVYQLIYIGRQQDQQIASRLDSHASPSQ